jgi:hypothetical protein
VTLVVVLPVPVPASAMPAPMTPVPELETVPTTAPVVAPPFGPEPSEQAKASAPSTAVWRAVKTRVMRNMETLPQGRICRECWREAVRGLGRSGLFGRVKR